MALPIIFSYAKAGIIFIIIVAALGVITLAVHFLSTQSYHFLIMTHEQGLINYQECMQKFDNATLCDAFIPKTAESMQVFSLFRDRPDIFFFVGLFIALLALFFAIYKKHE